MHIFWYVWVLSRMKYNDAITMWFMIPQEKGITALKLLEHFRFKHIKGLGGGK